MDVLVKAVEGFAHGQYNLTSGQQAVMDGSLARDLGGLVEILTTGAAGPAPKMLPAPEENKANPSVAGEARQSSASPAARVSPLPTATPSDSGAKRARAGR